VEHVRRAPNIKLQASSHNAVDHICAKLTKLEPIECGPWSSIHGAATDRERPADAVQVVTPNHHTVYIYFVPTSDEETVVIENVDVIGNHKPEDELNVTANLILQLLE